MLIEYNVQGELVMVGEPESDMQSSGQIWPSPSLWLQCQTFQNQDARVGQFDDDHNDGTVRVSGFNAKFF